MTEQAQRPRPAVGTAALVVASILMPIVGIVWGTVRVCRGDVAFGVGVIAMSSALIALLVALS